MTHEELEKRIIEARLNKIGTLEGELENWAMFSNEEYKLMKKLLKALENYEDFLLKKVN